MQRWNGVQGEYATPTCQLFPPGIPGYRPYCPYQKGPAEGPYQGPDLDKARALVADSGTVNIPIVVRDGPFPTLEESGVHRRRYSRALGYQVSVEPVEQTPASVTDEYQSRYDSAGFLTIHCRATTTTGSSRVAR